MRRVALFAAMLVASPAVADELVTQRWPDVPADPAPSTEDQITDHLSAIGDRIGDGLNEMSGQVLSLRVDGRHNSARIGIGRGGSNHYLTFHLDSNWLFAHGQAHIDATLELGLGSHHLQLQLPGMDIIPDNWHGQDLVVMNFNLLQRRF